MKKETLQVPQGALRMVASGCHAHVEFAQDGDGEKKPKLNMLAYSGKVIKGHWYWDDLAIDLSGIQFGKKKYPILEEHMQSRKIAFSKGPPSVENNELRFNPDKVEFVDTPFSAEFQKLSSEGFPYESSVYVTPTNVERLEPGAFAEVNGFTMKGPGTIFRKCTFNEASICVFGWDRQTESAAFSKEKVELSVETEDIVVQIEENNEKEVKEKMDLAQLKKDHPDLVLAIQSEVKTELVKETDKEKDVLSAQISDVTTELAKKDERILELEKRDSIRAEKELKAHATAIWAEKLAASGVPEHLYEKVQKHVSHSKFVAEGKFNEEEFKKAVDVEITSWEDLGITDAVIGTSFSVKKDVDGASQLAKKKQEENDETVSTLLSLAGQKKEKV